MFNKIHEKVHKFPYISATLCLYMFITINILTVVDSSSVKFSRNLYFVIFHVLES